MKYLKLFESKKGFSELTQEYIYDILVDATDRGILEMTGSKELKNTVYPDRSFRELYGDTILGLDKSGDGGRCNMIWCNIKIEPICMLRRSMIVDYSETVLKQAFKRIHDNYDVDILFKAYIHDGFHSAESVDWSSECVVVIVERH